MNITCKYCQKSVKNTGGHSKKCKEYQSLINSITKEQLEDMYFNKNMSCLDIQKYFDFHNFDIVYKLFDKFDIKRRSLKESKLLCKNKFEETNLKKYGHKHNFCKDHPSRKEWEQKLLDEEGITNVFQREDVKKKSIETLIQKYGVEKAGLITTCRGKNSYSQIHRKVVEICQELNIQVGIEFKLKYKKRYFAYDIIIENTNKLIEVNGDYWHGNPQIYKDSDIIMKNSSAEITVGEKWKKDKVKINHAKSNGYKVLTIWEKDLKENIEYIMERIILFASQN